MTFFSRYGAASVPSAAFCDESGQHDEGAKGRTSCGSEEEAGGHVWTRVPWGATSGSQEEDTSGQCVPWDATEPFWLPFRSSSNEENESRSRSTSLDQYLFVMLTCCYCLYRSRCPVMWGSESGAFTITSNDAWGLVFVAAYYIFGRVSYLVYAINPIRNLVLVIIQARFPPLTISGDVKMELIRDIISAACQLFLAFFLLQLCKANSPTRYNTDQSALANLVHASPLPTLAEMKSLPAIALGCTLWLVFCALSMTSLGFYQNTDSFTNVTGNCHGLKIVFAAFLGMSEEITWRQVYMSENGIMGQAFAWGMVHFCVPDRLYNPFQYGLMAFTYGFFLGSTPYRVVRYWSHFATEYIAVNNLIGAAAVAQASSHAMSLLLLLAGRPA